MEVKLLIVQQENTTKKSSTFSVKKAALTSGFFGV